MEMVCVVCDAKAPHRCSSCSLVAYCSAEHQKEHWKIHRKNCSYFKIVEDTKLGKGFIATRDIKPGTVILDEDPVAVAPTNRSQFSCVTCGCFYPGARKCSKCKLRVCSLECEELALHSENECPIFASQKMERLPEYSNGVLFDDLVMGIRVCMLKRDDPVMYQQVLELSSEHPLRDEMAMTGFYLKLLLADVEGVKLDCAEVAKLLKIFRINCLTSTRQQQQSGIELGVPVRPITGLYLRSSQINHSCIPNCHWELGYMPEFKIRIRTTTAVKKGEALTLCYYMECIEESTLFRQQIIQKKGNFRCECVRCKDPTELGTFVCGIICETCRGVMTSTSGYFLPEEPFNLSNDAKWKCNCCGSIQLGKDILQPLMKFGRNISNMKRKFGNKPDDDRLIDFCKKFINDISGITVHRNHWVIKIAMTIMGRYILRHRKTTMTLDLSEYFIKCRKHLLSVLDLLTPGLTLNRAIIQVGLASALHQHSSLLPQQNCEQVAECFEESLGLYKEALKFYNNELPTAEGFTIASSTIQQNMARVLDDQMLFRLNQLEVSGSM